MFSFQDKTVRMWNIESSDDIPVVLEHRKNIGLRIVQVCFRLKAGFHMIAAIATKKLSDPYNYKFPCDHYRIKKCPRGPGTNSGVLHPGIFFIATISGEWFLYDRNVRYER